ncbi:MAG TPA: UDP-3-O-(3-hydroxymyristoyl)glucosamine N-acyltransferase [Bacteroidales bacterium]|nr:UDP-3-O-(3-hydroxymyristoyl)glucosamine N-acyltransferase [Bacteroidales bacterium]
MMKFTAKTIAEYLKGEIEGNPDVEVTTVAKIEEGFEGAISFLANPNYEKYVYYTESSIVLVNRDFVPAKKVKATLIRVDNSYESFASLLTLYEESKPKKKGIHPTAIIEGSATVDEVTYIGAMVYVGENVSIGEGCIIHPHASIGDNTTIGKNSIIYSGVRIYHDCKVGDDCIIHAGSVIGSDGFGFAPVDGNNYKKIPQVGNVILEENVEIGANVVIDRATMGSTIIRKGVKLDNLIQIAHNVEVGENTVIAAQSGIAGSTRIGKNCMFGGQVGIIGHVKIADGTKAAAQSGISGSVKDPDTFVYGSPAFDFKNYQKSYIIFRKLPELKERLEEIERKVDSINEG